MYIHLLRIQKTTLPSRPPSLARPSASCFSSPHRQVLDAVAVPPAPNTVEPSPSVACLQPSGRTGAPAGPFHALREPNPVSAIAAMFASETYYPWQSRRSAVFD